MSSRAESAESGLLRKTLRLRHIIRTLDEPLPRLGRFSVPLIRPPENCENRRPHPFAYTPLPTPTSIRLLRIKEEEINDEFDLYRPIHCSLETVDLNDPPRYDALSYTWGSPVAVYSKPSDVSSDAAWAAPAFDITCDGQPFSVTTNLFTALLSIRFRTGASGLRRVRSGWKGGDGDERPDEADYHALEPLIWIDQICINQADVLERAAQVRLMGRVYKQAAKVSVWLGGADVFSPSGLEFMVNLTTNIDKETAMKLFTPLNFLDAVAFRAAGVEPVGPRQWLAAYAFMNRSWFRRTWAIQEVALARNLTFTCGLATFPIQIISRAFERLRETCGAYIMSHYARTFLGHSTAFSLEVSAFQEQTSERISIYQPDQDMQFCTLLADIVSLRVEHLGYHHRSYQAGTIIRAEQYGLGEIVSQFRETVATDPRDKIYGFLGLAEALDHVTQSPKLPSVDYGRSVEGVFTDAMQHLLCSADDGIKYLSLKETSSQTKIPGLPSWVPDFTVAMVPTPLSFYYKANLWTAGTSLKRKIRKLEFLENGALRLQGCRIGEVVATYEFERFPNLGTTEGNGSLLSLLQNIPKFSQIRIPTLTPQLKLYLQTAGRPMKEEGEMDASDVVCIDGEGTVAEQSRFEVFWRTLVTDSFEREYPASSGTAELFTRAWRDSLNTLVMCAGLMSDPKLGLGDVFKKSETSDAYDWEELKVSISRMYTTQLLLLNGGDGEDICLDDRILLPPQMEKVLPYLDSAWARGEVCPEGRSLAKAAVGAASIEGNVSWQTILTGCILRDDDAADKLVAHISYNREGKVVFATKEGQLGLGTKDLKVGDEVWVFPGAQTPYLLRPRGTGEFELLGESYVHGSMHGEVGSGDSTSELNTILLT